MKYFTLNILVLFLLMNDVDAQERRNDKIAIYQIFTRLFANTNTTNKFNGTFKENGCTKFNDINQNALKAIKDLGISHVWYTGIIEHATMTDYSKFGILNDHPQVVKGIAGSPYAIKDYYDVNPDYAVDVKNRMQEFEQLVTRTHANKLKVIIDFVPNHVARQYHSDVKPEGILDFGQNDNQNVNFDNQNNFYYIPNQKFEVPAEVNPPIKFDKNYEEFPAKATGNDVFSATTSINDWFETVKLNYGVDYQNGKTKHFEPIPSTWLRMKDILSFWANKGIDGFRCDMAEMVPVEFWAWVIPQINVINPNLIFIAEVYNPQEYRNYIFTGKFDYLYDKVGLYDALRRLIEGHGNAQDITKVWQNESGDFSEHMLRFLENHDEQRIASDQFGKMPESAFAAMMLSATMQTGPIMLYAGQEFGVKPTVAEGFQGNDGRTTIFDYWGLPEMQNFISNGDFSTIKLSKKEKSIRDFYKKTLKLAQENKAISKGSFFDLQYLNSYGKSEGYNESTLYSYLRYEQDQVLLFVYNFDLKNSAKTHVKLPTDVITKQIGQKNTFSFSTLFETKSNTFAINNNTLENVGFEVNIKPNSFKIFEIK